MVPWKYGPNWGLEMVSKKIDQLIKSWTQKREELKHGIDMNYPKLWEEQKHLKDSEAHAYYLYGRYTAFVEVIEQLYKKEK
jgi:hypothetical protein